MYVDDSGMAGIANIRSSLEYHGFRSPNWLAGWAPPPPFRWLFILFVSREQRAGEKLENYQGQNFEIKRKSLVGCIWWKFVPLAMGRPYLSVEILLLKNWISLNGQWTCRHFNKQLLLLCPPLVKIIWRFYSIFAIHMTLISCILSFT